MFVSKGQPSSEKTKELVVEVGVKRRGRAASLELGPHLQEGGLLLHDAHQQRVNVVLQIFDLRLQLLQLNLPLRQQTFLLLKLLLLLLELRLPLDQQSHQVAVVQVVVRAGSSRHQLSSRGERYC